MKLCSILVAFCALIFSTSFVSAEEHPVPFITSISSTTIRGYISAGMFWQEHVCRPVLPIRPRPVLQQSAGSRPRTIGHNVRCRHGVLFVPNAANRRVFPSPNSSSRFSSAGAMPSISYETYLVLMEANRLYSQPGRPPLPPHPSLPPSTSFPPLPTYNGYSSVSVMYVFSDQWRVWQFSPEHRAALEEFVRQDPPPDVPHDINLEARRLWMDRRPTSQPPSRFVREPQ